MGWVVVLSLGKSSTGITNDSLITLLFLVRPLTDLMPIPTGKKNKGKKKERREWYWGENQMNAFDTLKRLGHVVTFSVLSGSISTPAADTICPTNFTFRLKNEHFFGASFKLACCIQ
jgi:hypothetical protein